MKPIVLVLEGIPLSTNSIYKSHCKFGYPNVYMTKEGKDLKESYQWQIKSQYKGKILDCPVSIDVKLYRVKDSGDIDNFNKILFDSLTKMVWVDDKQIQSMSIGKFTDKKNPRIEIVINCL